MKKLYIFAIISALSVVSLFSVIIHGDDCVTVYVDYGKLNSETKRTMCVSTSTKVNALDLLKQANLRIEGTRKYGDGVICRVNGLPDITVESCEVMPPAEAYWAIIIKKKQVVLFPRNEWGWGQLAVNQQYLNPGDSIGLVWANDGKVVFP